MDLFHLSVAAAVMYTLLVKKTNLIERLQVKSHNDGVVVALYSNSFAVTGLPDLAPNSLESECAVATYPLLISTPVRQM